MINEDRPFNPLHGRFVSKSAPKLSILIIDDSLLIRRGLKQLIEEAYHGTIFGECGTGAKAVVKLSERRWDLVILDVSLPDRDAFSLLLEMSRKPGIDLPVLMLGMHADRVFAARARQLGARGYVAKNARRADLFKAIKQALGENLSSHGLAGTPPWSGDTMRAILSAREYEVMLALARGKRTGEIAAELGLNSRTVSTFKRRVLNKLQLESIVDLVRYVTAHKLA